MRAQIDVLREVFVEWLKMHDLDYDFWVYTAAEWSEREKEHNLLRDAELVLVCENQLSTILTVTGPLDVGDELQDLANGFGYYFDFGDSLTLGFIPLDDWPPLPPSNASYSELLRDQRWQQKRKRILARCQGRCEQCDSARQLDVHHTYYRFGRQPWQYPDGAFLALCRDCHMDRSDAELRFRLFAPLLSSDELRLLVEVQRHVRYWFDRETFNRLLAAMSNVPGGLPKGAPTTLAEDEYERLCNAADYQLLHHKLVELLRTKGHPDETDRDYPFHI